jgi:hypothetical protein
MKAWNPSGVYKGVFDDFAILANRFSDDKGLLAWHLHIYPNTNASTLHSYWITDANFHGTGRQLISSEGAIRLETGQPIEPPPAHLAAIQKAFAKWAD